MNYPDNLVCPLDRARLRLQGRQLVCPNGHAFDIARQGHVNLLPVQHKRSRHPGDSKAMVLARTAFLGSGAYRPIALKLVETVLAQLAALDVGQAACVLDAGCGEGYYLQAVQSALAGQGRLDGVACVGVDISKEAIIQSARRSRTVCWVVGTNRCLPVEDGSVDLILCLFGFFSAEGFGRALKPGGRVIMVDPAARHLQELREIIYPELTRTGSPAAAAIGRPGFRLRSAESLTFGTKVSGAEQVRHLLVMTPHFYRAGKAGREAAARLSELDITVDVVFRVLEKAAAMPAVSPRSEP